MELFCCSTQALGRIPFQCHLACLGARTAIAVKHSFQHPGTCLPSPSKSMGICVQDSSNAMRRPAHTSCSGTGVCLDPPANDCERPCQAGVAATLGCGWVTLVPPEPYSLVLAAAAHLLSIGTPVDRIHLVLVPRQVHRQLARRHRPHLQSRIFRPRYEKSRIGRKGALINGRHMSSQRVDELAIPGYPRLVRVRHINGEQTYLALQSLVWLSQPALAMRLPSGENVTWFTCF